MVNVEIKTLEPPLMLNPDSMGDSMFLEALCYKSLKLIDVGKHISCFLTGSELHIHFRRNLKKIKRSGFKGDLELARAFSKRIGNDLSKLSGLFMRNDRRFKDVKTVIGLTGLGAAWGRSHGWTTQTYTENPDLIKLHESTIEGKPITTNPGKLTIFTISREDHIKNFPPPTSHKIHSRQG